MGGRNGLGPGVGLWALLLGACGGGSAGTATDPPAGTSTSTSTTSVTTSGTEGTTTLEVTTGEPPTTGITTDVATTSGDIPPIPVCGDGVLDPEEGCDNGPANADDGECTTQCQIASCGDGLIQAGTEDCDDGPANADDAACTLACVVASCGDTLVQAGVEDCDDGNADDADACLNSCKAAGCGDGIIGPGEACDDGNQIEEDTCTNSCAPPNCGDAKLQVIQGEECDDGNQIETDACLTTCVAAKCGDGLVLAGTEECDDANLDETDTCTAACKTPTCSDEAKNGTESDLDCGGACMKCGLGNTCQANADCSQGLCIAGTCSIARSCKQIKEAAPNSKDNNYQIDPDAAGPIKPLQVHCDMDAGMCGYTWIRFDDPALLNDQNAYAAKCAAVGMEVLVTRTKPHAQAFYDWNLSDQANLLNIFPKVNGSQSINNWQGICQGAPCGFWMTDNANGDVGCGNFEPNGDNILIYRIYRVASGCNLQGRWNDFNNTISIQGWVVCSPNDC